MDNASTGIRGAHFGSSKIFSAIKSEKRYNISMHKRDSEPEMISVSRRKRLGDDGSLA